MDSAQGVTLAGEVGIINCNIAVVAGNGSGAFVVIAGNSSAQILNSICLQCGQVISVPQS